MSPEILYLLAYAIGAFPTSYLTGKLFYKVNLLEHGSKNVGATNAFRVLGKKAGIFVLTIDILKGFFPVLAARLLYPHDFGIMIKVCIIAVLGHTFSVFLRFKGGKGVATSAGAFLAMVPKALLLSVFVFLVVFRFSGYVSLGSITSALSLPLFCFLFYPQQPIFSQLGAVVCAFIVFKHRTNIQRLLNGTENKFRRN